MQAKIKINELPEGMIIWKGSNIIGVTGMTLSNEYYDCYCIKLPGNDLDYKLI